MMTIVSQKKLTNLTHGESLDSVTVKGFFPVKQGTNIYVCACDFLKKALL